MDLTFQNFRKFPFLKRHFLGFTEFIFLQKVKGSEGTSDDLGSFFEKEECEEECEEEG